jgi:hypothetical protein
MPSSPKKATVRHTLVKDLKVADGLAILDNVCSTGAQCPQVQSSALAKAALGNLTTATATAHTGLSNRKQIAQALLAAIKTLAVDYGQAKAALVAYEAAVNTVAQGDASIITLAGLLSRDTSVPHATLGTVTGVRSKPGTETKQAIVSWPEVAGATSYALQVSFTPQTAGSAYTALSSGSRRRRVITAPAAGAQFLVQIAALGGDGTQSGWSDAILATAR